MQFVRNAAIVHDLEIRNAPSDDTNYSGNSVIDFQLQSKFGSVGRFLLRFKKPKRIRAGDTIDSAILTINFTDGVGGFSGKDARVSPILNASRVTADATWNTYDGSSAWGTPGVDFDDTSSSIVSVPVLPGVVQWEIAGSVERAIALNPQSPYIDLLIKFDNELVTVTAEFNAYADDGTAPDPEAPTLEITFTENRTHKTGGGITLVQGGAANFLPNER